MTPVIYLTLAAVRDALIVYFDRTLVKLGVGNCIITLDSVSLPHLNRMYVELMDGGGSFTGTGGAMERSGRFRVAIRNKLMVTNLGNMEKFSQELLSVAEQIRSVIHNNPSFGLTDLPQVVSEDQPKFEQHPGPGDNGDYIEGVIEQTYSAVKTLDFATYKVAPAIDI